jgi:prepilin-type N-terminal cleavage/methylation domain-containing protein
MCKYRAQKNGFTLIEMMVAVTIFSIVMLVAVGSLVSIIDANRKAQALQSVTNNLAFALEGMSRSIRVGYNYHCRDNVPSSNSALKNPSNCAGGGAVLAFEAHDGDPSDDDDQIVYFYDGSSLFRSDQGIDNFIPITAPEVNITNFSFYVLGANNTDNIQPQVLILMDGVAGITGSKTETKFNIQTSVTQRTPDL